MVLHSFLHTIFDVMSNKGAELLLGTENRQVTEADGRFREKQLEQGQAHSGFERLTRLDSISQQNNTWAQREEKPLQTCNL